MSDPRVGVVVITRDRVHELLACVDRLKQTEAAHIVVVDNASTDGSAYRLRGRHPDVDVVALPRNAAAAGRTLGVARCPTPYVAFCDDDSAWEPGALRRAADLMDAAPEAGVLSARLLLEDGGEDPLCAVLAAGRLGRGRVGPHILGFAACAAVVRRGAFLEVGGFHPALGVGGEEELLAMDMAAAGWSLEYAAEVVARHTPSPQRDRRARRRRVLRNRLLTAWLRRPAPTALALTARGAAGALRDPPTLRGAVEVLAALRLLRRGRCVNPDAVEAALRRLEAARAVPPAPSPR